MKQETIVQVLEAVKIAIEHKHNTDNLLPMIEETISKIKEEGIED